MAMVSNRLLPLAAHCFTMVSAACLFSVAAMAQDIHVRVAPGLKAGDTQFPTIQMALDHAADPGPGGRLFVHIAPGTYNERPYISRNRMNVTLIGDGKDPAAVVITGSQNAAESGGTFLSAITNISGDGFEADNVTFANTAGPTGQAVAVAVNADRVIFKHCRFLGYQDTLFANSGRQYYTDSYIAGAVDFIFGNATAVFARDEIHVTHPGYVTAQSRTDTAQTTGYVITDSRVTAEGLDGKSFYLGRPWRAWSRVVYLHTYLPAGVNPEGWSEWQQNAADLSKVFYGEYDNRGPGASMKQRPSWIRHLTAPEAAQFATETFLRGADGWDPQAEAAKLP